MERQPLRRGPRAPRKFPSWTLFLAVCAVGIGGTFQYGYNVSIINAPTQHIHRFLNETWTSRYHKELNPDLLTFLWSVIASIFSLGGLCGALIGGSMAIRLGRKGALLMNNIIAILASILMGISFPTGLFELLIAGRFLIGINSGVGLCVQPLYIGEVAPKHLRGGMAMGSSIFLTGGILTGQIIGLSFLLETVDIRETGLESKGLMISFAALLLALSLVRSAILHCLQHIILLILTVPILMVPFYAIHLLIRSTLNERELLGGETYWPLLLSSSCFPAFAQLLFLPWFPESPRYLLIDRGDELSCAKEKVFGGRTVYLVQRSTKEVTEALFMEAFRPRIVAAPDLMLKSGWSFKLVTLLVITMALKSLLPAASKVLLLPLTLKRFHGSSEYQREMEDIQRECFALDGEKPKKPWQLFTDRGVRWQLITVIVMTMGQQLSGINAIYFYATYIFKQAGISAEKIPYVTLGTGACECLTALTCGLLIDYVGRRCLIIGGYLFMALWSIVLTFSLTYQDLYSWVPYVSMTSILAFILSFGLGPGGITNTLTAELFIQSSRPAAYMIAGTISWISFFTIGMLFPFIVNGLKQYCFLVFLLECSLVAAFIFLVIPETKNKSFLEIEKEFHKLNFGRNTKKKETELYERRQLHDEF